MRYREESDTMGTVLVPEDAYYGAETQRAVENFAISGLVFHSSFYSALGMIKKYAAKVNMELGLLEPELGRAIMTAAEEVQCGKLHNQFVVDVFQTGSGTSTNMNANEVIASRANEIITGKPRAKSPVHPNDHVNRGQSSNDVIPTAIHIAALVEIRQRLLPAMGELALSLKIKAEEFADVRKIGRTHVQDAVPISLGNEFSGYERQVELGIARVKALENSLSELALGGTAVGSGLNAHPEFAAAGHPVDFRGDRLPIQRGCQSFRSPGCSGRGSRGQWRSQDICCEPHQDRKRYQVACFGAPLWPRRDKHPRTTARLFDHAGKSQPGDSGDRNPGCCTGDRKRRCDNLWRTRRRS